MIIRFWLLFVMAALFCQANGTEILTLFKDALSQSPTEPLKEPEWFGKVNENTVGVLTDGELASILPLAEQCLVSARPELKQAGILFMLAAVMRPDSAKKLTPSMSALETIASDPGSPLKNTALYILGSTRPTITPGAVSFLLGHLPDNDNTPEQTLTIATSLLEDHNAQPDTLKKVLIFVQSNSNPILIRGVLAELGLQRKRDENSLDFIAAAFDNTATRHAAIGAVGRLDRDVRMRFLNQLKQIANDSDESPEIRSAAAAVLVSQ